MQSYVDGDALKIARMSMPQRNGRTVLWMGQRGHPASDILDPLENALSSGKLDPSQLLAGGAAPSSCKSSKPAKFGNAASWGTSSLTRESGDCVWSVQVTNSSCPRNGMCELPQYYKKMKPVDASEVSAKLRNQRFPTAPQSDGAYDALTTSPMGGCRDSPGPADKILYCAKTFEDTWIGYRWYRFVDQPGLQQMHLSATERAFMQKRVETLHRLVPTSVSRWINGREAAAEGLASMDPAAIATPPKGLEIGYVPIILYQGVKKPADCTDSPPSRPSPTPAGETELVV